MNGLLLTRQKSRGKVEIGKKRHLQHCLQHVKPPLKAPTCVLEHSNVCAHPAVDFFNQINMLYGTITEFCTEASCPVMSAGPRYEYHWADGTNIKKPIKCSAPKYIDYLMTWVQDQLDDETLFPSKIGVPFPKNFMSVAKTILKRLFRVYAHIYHQHFDSVMQLQEEAHLNTSFKHFIFFVQEFNLIDRRELAPLQELIEKLGSKDR
ncbi:MOB kinase activator 1A isoform X3 [Erinaceus europaeus]|uniref:MOB kinase activator 1A isoform X3 n=1 Tax=Erinaceus europaeus TaxID=9365 RepID=A0ABM3X2L1_ERIEU|nr:MOB kinase activator 1A isoform X3 [Erinaceus europaeus]